eukprot:Lankesteria_metandrocarpae@DN5232_c0_g1_i3.p1
MVEPPNNIRNVCVLAHVDHGKTTLSDHLIASNGFISSRTAGKLRFLDSREDEQTRFITMKSSCITLKYRPKPTVAVISNAGADSHGTTASSFKSGASGTAAATQQVEARDEYFVNLVDSPGHVDFSSEVAAAVRLCDGALVLVDAVEGVCPQTRQVLAQAWKERTKMLLVINKMDRLLSDLNLSPDEAYSHLREIVCNVNAIVQQFLSQEVMQEAAAVPESDNVTAVIPHDESEQGLVFDDEFEASLEFCPSRGNVIFASGYYNWGFDVPKFAALIAQKLKMPLKSVPKLQQAMWGDFFFNGRTGVVTTKPPSPSSKPVFVQFVLEQLWKVHEVAAQSEDKLNGLLVQLKLESASNQIKAQRAQGLDASNALLASWLPMSDCVMNAIVRELPTPREAIVQRITHLCPSASHEAPPKVYRSITECSSDSSTVAYVAKFLSADLRHLRLTGDKLQGLEEMSSFVGLVRVFAGKLRAEQRLYVCGTADSQRSGSHTYNADDSLVGIKRVFMLRGRDLIPVDELPAGQIGAVSLDSSVDVSTAAQFEDILGWILSLRDMHSDYSATGKRPVPRLKGVTSLDRSVTLSSDSLCPPLVPTYSDSVAILRVSIEPTNICDSDALLRGLALLYKADPAVEVDVLSTGERVLGCCGSVHLERCISDLVNLYARVPIRASEPLVAIRETIADLSEDILREGLHISHNAPLAERDDDCAQQLNAAAVSLTQAVSRRVPFPPWAPLVAQPTDPSIATASTTASTASTTASTASTTAST